MYTNVIFNNEKEADDFGKRSMKIGFEHKVVEYDSENYKKYWSLSRPAILLMAFTPHPPALPALGDIFVRRSRKNKVSSFRKPNGRLQ